MDHPLAAPGSTPQTRIHRLPDKAVNDRTVAYAILDTGLVAHVGVIVDGVPVVSPMGYGRQEDAIVLHGSRASRLMKAMAAGAPLCVNVTLLEGLVVARSLFESSMHYRSVTILGRAREVPADALLPALQALSDHLLPGRWSEARQPTAQELRATLTVSLPLDEIAVKVSAGPPEDTDEDRSDPRIAASWAGIVPLESRWGHPIPDASTPPGVLPPASLDSWTRSREP